MSNINYQWAEGYRAGFNSNRESVSNPYEEKSVESMNWNMGYKEGVYDLGWDKGFNGRPASNPFDWNTKEHDIWDTGYSHGRSNPVSRR